jgi:Uncharacterised protein family UPF0547
MPRVERARLRQCIWGLQMNEIIVAKQPAELPVSVPPLETMPVANLVNCPFCDEQVSVNAKKCRHCGETIDVSMRKAEEALRATKHQPQAAPQVFMNAGGGASGAGFQQLRPWGHGIHIIMSFLTLGMWIPLWLLLYVLRNRAIYF